MLAELAMELSARYQKGVAGLTRVTPGLGNDWEVREDSHLFWARAMLAYTLPEVETNLSLTLTAGTSVHADRLMPIGSWVAALGGGISFDAAGLLFQEISAKEFALLAGSTLRPSMSSAGQSRPRRLWRA